MADKLRVMLVDQRAERCSGLAEGLEQAGCLVVEHAVLGGDLERAIARTQPDVVIIDLESPDRDTLEGMRRIGAEDPRPIVMFVDESDQESIRTAVRAGVAAYVVKGASPERVRPVIDVAIARFQEAQLLKNELNAARTSLEERKVVERAKGILTEKRGVAEPDAYRLLRKTAMDRSMRLVDVARRVIEMQELL